MAINFVEGLPGAGKSLLVKHMEQQGEPIVHELGRVIDPSEFPGNGNSPKEVAAIDEWFIAREAERMTVAGAYDRSYFTHLTYAFAYSRYTGLDTFQPTVDRYAQQINKGRIVLPDTVTYLDIDPEESIRRQLHKIAIGRRPLDAFWREEEFLSNLRVAYSHLFRNCSGIAVQIIDGNLSTEEKYHLVSERSFLTSEHDKPRPRGLNLGQYTCDLLKET